MESNTQDTKKSRVEEMLKEDLLAREVFIALKAEQVVLFKRLSASLTKLAVVISAFATVGLGFVIFYLNKPSPAQEQLLNEIKDSYRVLKKEEERFRVEREIFYGIRKADSTVRAAHDSVDFLDNLKK